MSSLVLIAAVGAIAVTALLMWILIRLNQPGASGDTRRD